MFQKVNFIMLYGTPVTSTLYSASYSVGVQEEVQFLFHMTVLPKCEDIGYEVLESCLL